MFESYIMVALFLMSFYATPAFADTDEQALAKASQNPVAAMISLPLKNKFSFGAGSENAFSYELEMQPDSGTHINEVISNQCP